MLASTAIILLSLSLPTWQRSAAGGAAPTSGARDAAAPATPMLAIQVRLDRTGYSPGEIDGRGGANTARALRAFQRRHGMQATGHNDRATTRALEALDSAEVLSTYQINEVDLAGPFEPMIPADLTEQAALPSLAFKSVVEMLGERFHASPRLLQRLNPRAMFAAAGESIRVPHITVPPAVVDQAAVVVTVSKQESTLTVESDTGDFLFHAPVTTGSEVDPLPIGDWTVTGVFRDPVFHYNPDLFWDADPAHAKARIAPGPNNPVGLVWIDLSREHYGLHGSPEPRLVGRTQSHGCVRLTNWDALRVASLVTKGTRVRFRE